MQLAIFYFAIYTYIFFLKKDKHSQVTNNLTILFENLLLPSQKAEDVACVAIENLASRRIELTTPGETQTRSQLSHRPVFLRTHINDKIVQLAPGIFNYICHICIYAYIRNYVKKMSSLSLYEYITIM